MPDDTRDTRPLYTPPSTTPAMPDTPGYVTRPRHARIEKGHAAQLSGAGKESHRATPIGFIEKVEAQAQEDKTEKVEDRQKWLASADAGALAAAVREALDAQDAGGDEIAIIRAFTTSEIETIFALGLEQWQQMIQTIKSISQTNQETDP